MHSVNSGRISYSDFLIATLNWRDLIDNESIWGAFCSIDKDRDGKIRVNDVRQALMRAGCQLSDEDFSLLVAEYNQVTNPAIDFEEFKRLVLVFNDSYSDQPSPLLTRKRTFNQDAFMRTSSIGHVTSGYEQG
jgi:Ca2+-binding EF-hand superfamily protein